MPYLFDPQQVDRRSGRVVLETGGRVPLAAGTGAVATQMVVLVGGGMTVVPDDQEPALEGEAADFDGGRLAHRLDAARHAAASARS